MLQHELSEIRDWGIQKLHIANWTIDPNATIISKPAIFFSEVLLKKKDIIELESIIINVCNISNWVTVNSNQTKILAFIL